MCILSIKVPLRKKSGNLFNDPRICYKTRWKQTYFYHIDDILLIYPRNNDLTKSAYILNKIEPTIDYPYELDNNTTLTFLNILLMNNNKLKFKVHHKSTNKNDHRDFYSHHNTKVMKGLMIDFKLSALMICIHQFLNDEFEYIKKFLHVASASFIFYTCQNKSSQNS